MGRRFTATMVMVYGVMNVSSAMAQPGSHAGCDIYSGSARGICIAYCNQCVGDDVDRRNCEVLLGKFVERTGDSVPPCDQAATPTSTATASATATFTPIFTMTATSTPEGTATETPTPTATDTATATAIATATATQIFTATATSTPEGTATETSTPTATDTATVIATATFTPIFTMTATSTPEGTATETATATATETPIFTMTATSSPEGTATETPTPTLTATPIVTFTFTSAAEGIAEELSPTSRSFEAELSGDNEVPSVATDAEGTARLQLSNKKSELRYRLRVTSIEGVTQAHIHCGIAGVNGPVVAFLFGPNPAGIDPRRRLASGTIEPSDVIAVPDSAQCPGGIASFDELIAKIQTGAAYVNVHTLAHPTGEIRGPIERR